MSEIRVEKGGKLPNCEDRLPCSADLFWDGYPLVRSFMLVMPLIQNDFFRVLRCPLNPNLPVI